MGKKEAEDRRTYTAVDYYSEAFRSAMVNGDHADAAKIITEARKMGLEDLALKFEGECEVYADQEHGVRGSN